MYVSEDYEIGFERSVVNSTIDHFEANWGTGVGMSMYAPSRASDPAARAYWARYQTISASPSSAAAFLRGLTAIDVRHALPAITVPTLLLHPARDAVVPVEAARDMQRHIPGATLVELDSDIHLIWLSDAIDDITREIESFIARAVPATDVHRALAIVLAVALAACRRTARHRSSRASSNAFAGIPTRVDSPRSTARSKPSAAGWRSCPSYEATSSQWRLGCTVASASSSPMAYMVSRSRSRRVSPRLRSRAKSWSRKRSVTSSSIRQSSSERWTVMRSTAFRVSGMSSPSSLRPACGRGHDAAMR